MLKLFLAKLKYWLSPRTEFGKLLRDSTILFLATLVGYVIDNWADVTEFLQDETGGVVPGFVLAMLYALALYVMRKLRAHMP